MDASAASSHGPLAVIVGQSPAVTMSPSFDMLRAHASPDSALNAATSIIIELPCGGLMQNGMLESRTPSTIEQPCERAHSSAPAESFAPIWASRPQPFASWQLMRNMLEPPAHGPGGGAGG